MTKGTERAEVSEAVLQSAVNALNWRLTEGASRISAAAAALDRGDPGRARDKLYEIEPLVFEIERILSGTFVLISERKMPRSDIT